jgi:phage host-nuclease inhibitor protein Gam
MSTHSQTPSLADLDGEVSNCETACASAAERAIDTHLQTRLTNLAGQVDAMKTRVEDYVRANKSVAASTIKSLTQQAVSATQVMQNAKGDDGLYQAMSPVQQLCTAIQQDLPALS